MDYNNRKLEISQANPNFFGGFFSFNLKKSRSRIMDSFFKTSVSFSWKLKFSMVFSMVFLDPNGSDRIIPRKTLKLKQKKNPTWRFPRLKKKRRKKSIMSCRFSAFLKRDVSLGSSRAFAQILAFLNKRVKAEAGCSLRVLPPRNTLASWWWWCFFSRALAIFAIFGLERFGHPFLGGNPKIGVGPPKWMVKIMENPIK